MFTEDHVAELLIGFMKVKTEDILSVFSDKVRAVKTIQWPNYVYREGTSGILLVGHADTVWKDRISEPVLYKNCILPKHILEQEGIQEGINITKIFSRKYGIGADDRAGLALMFKILSSQDHSFIITTEEETGLGPPIIGYELAGFIDKHNFAVEFDRKGNNHFVCYNGDGKRFKNFIKKNTGFREETGSGSDIIMCEKLINSINVSTGYKYQHTPREMLVIDWWYHTYEIFSNFLGNVHKTKKWTDF